MGTYVFSMQRVGRFLAELRRDHGLPVTAVTATANRAVHTALRSSLFGIDPEPPAAGSDQERSETMNPDVRSGLVTVRENPIRPELAIFRRSLRQSGPSGVAGLALRRATGRLSPSAARKEEARIRRSLGSEDRPLAATA